MADVTNNSGNLTIAINGLNRFDGRNPGEFRDWHKTLAVVLGVPRRFIAPLTKGQTGPTEETSGRGISPALVGAHEVQAALDKAIAEYDRTIEDLYVILYLLTGKTAALLVSKHKDTAGTSGNGQPTLLELVGKCNKVTDEVIRSTMNKLVDSTMKQGQDRDNFIEKTLARAELEHMGEPISDRRFKDICVQGFTSEYKDIVMMMYRDPTFDIDQKQSTMRHPYYDELSRSNGAKGKIAARGVAMTAETTPCSRCGQGSHLVRSNAAKGKTASCGVAMTGEKMTCSHCGQGGHLV